MNKFVFSSAIDAFLSGAAGFFVFLYLFSKIIAGILPVTISLLLSAAVAAAVYFISAKRSVYKKNSLFLKNEFERRMLILYACSDGEIQKIFSKILDRLHICADVSGRHMEISGGNIIVAPLKTEPLSADDIIFIKRSHPFARSVTVISAAFSPNAVRVCRALSITPFPAVDFGRFLDGLGLLPAADKNIKKPSLLNRFSVFSEKQNGKRFLIYGAFLCALSPLVFYPAYYLIFGTIFTVYGLIALFFGKSKTKANSDETVKNLFISGQ